MARFTAILGNLSGKLGGNVFANNKGGSYARVWKKPTNPDTGAQKAVRANFSSGANFWKGLTGAERSGYNSFALGLFKPIKPKVGVIYSGFNAITALLTAVGNGNRLVRAVVLTESGITITKTHQDFIGSTAAPNYSLATQIQRSTGQALNLTLVSAILTAAGALTATLNTDATMANPVKWQNPGQTEYLGVAFFMSNPVSSSQAFIQSPLLQCIGVMKPPITGTGTITTPSNVITIAMTGADLDVASRKLWVTVGNVVQISAYLVSASGQMALFGTCKTTIT